MPTTINTLPTPNPLSVQQKCNTNAKLMPFGGLEKSNKTKLMDKKLAKLELGHKLNMWLFSALIATMVVLGSLQIAYMHTTVADKLLIPMIVSGVLLTASMANHYYLDNKINTAKYVMTNNINK